MHPCYLKTWPGTTGRNFKYENINGNDVYRVVGKKFDLAKFDFKVKSEVDLGHLSLDSHMAKFTSFNENCDGSAILSLLESVPSFVASVKAAAKTVKQDVRNEWAHCAFIDWDERKFHNCFRDMKLLLNAAGLTVAEHDLEEWELKGINLVKHSINGEEDLVEQDKGELRSLLCALNQSETEPIKVRQEISRLLQLESIVQEIVEKKFQEILEGRLTCTKDNAAVKKFIQILKRWYMSEETYIAPLPWMEDADFTLDKMYTPLVISQVNKGKERNIDMKEVFKIINEMGKTPVNVLLEGNPGAGKTTFCRKLAYHWAEGKVPKSGCEMLLFLKCRDVKGGCIWEAIEEQLLPEDTTAEEMEEIFLYIKSNQEKVMLIIDGYDEIPNAAESESIKESITKVIRKKALPLCCTLVTSRQSKSHGILKHFQRLLKIKGIASYEDYITSFFDDPPHAKFIIEHIKHNPNLCDLASNALNLALVCLVFKENSTQRINWKELTLSELYCEIVFCITKRYCKKKNLEVEDDDLMKTFRPQHLSLGKFAFDNLIKNEITFSAETLSNKIENMGFLLKEKSFKVIRQVEGGVYAFAHKSIQDYFAALYLADRLSQGVCDDALRLTDFEVFETINRYDLASMIGIDQVSHASKELAKMSSLCAIELPQPVLILICECLSECSRLPDFQQTLEDVYHNIPAKVDIRVPMDCRRKALSGLCCLLSYKNTENLASEAGNQVSFSRDVLEHCETRSTTPLNKLTLRSLQCNDLNPECGEALANNTTAVSSRMIFSDCLGEEDHRSICQVLKTNTSLHAFKVQGKRMNDESVCSIIDALSDNSTIQEFTLDNHDPDVGIFFPHIRAIFAVLLVCIVYLYMDGFSSLTWSIVFGAAIIAVIVVGFTDKGRTLRNVLLNVVFIAFVLDSFEIAKLFVVALFVSGLIFSGIWTIEYIGSAFVLLCFTILAAKRLMKFNKHTGKYGARVVKALSRMLRKNTHLRHLHLKSNKIGNDLACALGDVLAQSKTLETLEIDQGFIGESGAKGIARGLAQNSTLKSFTLRGMKYVTCIVRTYDLKVIFMSMFGSIDKYLCSPGTCAIVEALSRNHVIAHLDLSHNLIDDKGAKAIGKMLTTHTTVKTLRIGDNFMGEAGIKYIADGLSKNTGLEDLDISFNGAGDEGIREIANAVAKHRTLKVLNITRNDIGDVGLNAIVDACAKSNTLTELRHEDNPILERCSVFCRSNIVQDALSFFAHDTELFKSLSKNMLRRYLLHLMEETEFHEDLRAFLLAWQEWHYNHYLTNNELHA